MQKTEIDRLSRAIIEAESALSSKSEQIDSLRLKSEQLKSENELQKTEINKLKDTWWWMIDMKFRYFFRRPKKVLFRFSQQTKIINRSKLFDSKYYLENNPDVAAAGINPLYHYLAYGIAEGRNPNPLFDTSYYLKNNPDVAAAGINPLYHYLTYGIAEGRNPNPLFDTSYYLENNPDVAAAGINPLYHYLTYGSR